MNEKYHDALAACLQALEQGETLEAALERFPALAAELRPMLETALDARMLGDVPLPQEARRRGRARLLQAVAEMGASRRAPRRTWLFNIRPLAVALMLILFFLSSTGLVNASTTSLPGDNLYPVKRTWEDMRLIFASTEEEREGLEMEYENERLEEVSELLAEGRVEAVSFSGYVTAQLDGQWIVSGIPVTVTAETSLPGEPVTPGSVVTVFGMTTPGGILQAQSILMVPPGTPIPTPGNGDDEEEENETEGSGDNSARETDSGSSSGEGSGDSTEESDSEKNSKLEGILQSMDGNFWIINGQNVNVSGAEIIGTPSAGASVVVEGYFNADGVFVATRVIFENGGGGGQTQPEEDASDDPSDDDPEDGTPEPEEEIED